MILIAERVFPFDDVVCVERLFRRGEAFALRRHYPDQGGPTWSIFTRPDVDRWIWAHGEGVPDDDLTVFADWR